MKFVGHNVPYTWICFFFLFCACVCMITGPNHCDHMTKIEQGTLCIIISVLDILQLRLKVYNAYCLKIRLFIELSELQFSGTENYRLERSRKGLCSSFHHQNSQAGFDPSKDIGDTWPGITERAGQ